MEGIFQGGYTIRRLYFKEGIFQGGYIIRRVYFKEGIFLGGYISRRVYFREDLFQGGLIIFLKVGGGIILKNVFVILKEFKFHLLNLHRLFTNKNNL